MISMCLLVFQWWWGVWGRGRASVWGDQPVQTTIFGIKIIKVRLNRDFPIPKRQIYYYIITTLTNPW